jgi:REP element-mobilizing transposase RayT
VEYEGALYHVISRGNYRSPVFGTLGAKKAFEDLLLETARRAEWRLHAYVVMSNHYHLAIETPQPNLVAGMRWLQNTFAVRFNRFRQENGHVFQGRYKAMLVENLERLGAVAHYIHLNPVRAKLASVEQLHCYPASSYYWLSRPKFRPSCLCLETALRAAGDLGDTTAGRQSYAAYLTWLVEEDSARKAFCFDQMCKGWAFGSREFRKALVECHGETFARAKNVERDAQETKELRCEVAVEKALRRLGKTALDIRADPKSAPWKIAIAARLKTTSLAKNPWIATQLNMGDPDGVSRYVGEFHRGLRPSAQTYAARITDISV